MTKNDLEGGKNRTIRDQEDENKDGGAHGINSADLESDFVLDISASEWKIRATLNIQNAKLTLAL